MSLPRCAPLVLGAALLAGGLISAGFAFVTTVLGQIALPSFTIGAWPYVLALAEFAALLGGFLGVLTGAAAWSLAATGLVLIGYRRRGLLLRAVTTGAGAALGAGTVIWWLASRPGVEAGPAFVIGALAVAAGLAVGALLLGVQSGLPRCRLTP